MASGLGGLDRAAHATAESKMEREDCLMFEQGWKPIKRYVTSDNASGARLDRGVWCRDATPGEDASCRLF